MKIEFNIITLKQKKSVTWQEISFKTGIRYATLLKMKENKSTRIEKMHIESLLEYFQCELSELILVDKK